MALTEPTPAPPPQRGPRGAAWPIHLERKVTPGLTPGPKRHTVPPDARTSLDSAENEFMIFKGRHHAHWRQKFAGNYSYILLCAPARQKRTFFFVYIEKLNPKKALQLSIYLL